MYPASAAQQTEGAMDVLYRRCAGLDVHKDPVVAVSCVSAWKKDPLGGVIGVQKGPLC